MSYSLPADIREIKAITPTLKAYGADETAQNTAIQKVIDRVEVIINNRLKSKYTVPVTPVPDILERISVYKTAYEILVENYGDSEGKYSYFKKEAETLLSQIESGAIELVPVSDSLNSADLINPSGEDRYFTLG